MRRVYPDPGREEPLDATGVHPESYGAAEKLLKKQGFTPEDITARRLTGLSVTIRDYKKLAEELGIGEITLRDIVNELEKPARDPRDEMPKPILRTDVLEMKDLKEGMVLKEPCAMSLTSVSSWISVCTRTD